MDDVSLMSGVNCCSNLGYDRGDFFCGQWSMLAGVSLE
jgi:hypothetical protein